MEHATLAAGIPVLLYRCALQVLQEVPDLQAAPGPPLQALRPVRAAHGPPLVGAAPACLPACSICLQASLWLLALQLPVPSDLLSKAGPCHTLFNRPHLVDSLVRVVPPVPKGRAEAGVGVGGGWGSFVGPSS